jgi:hypothetical protein
VTVHFAYGANMSRVVMLRHAPCARPIGVAQLPGYRFVITADGYASVMPAPGQVVCGVMWRLTARDRVTLDAWENVTGGLYCAEILPVRMRCRRVPALVYRARTRGGGRPKSGYMELVRAAAREWELPEAYLQSLVRWSPPRGPTDSASEHRPPAKIREFG